MFVCTIIPARGGSKSIPMKNISMLNGRPLLQYSIEYSLKCSLVNKTVVSTDSMQIAEIARNCGAEVPFIRPKEIAEDLTQDFPVMLHAMEEIEIKENIIIDFLVLLRPTSPLRPPQLIEKGLELLQADDKATSIRSVTPSREHPYRQWNINGPYMSGFKDNIVEPYNIPRQLLPEVFFQTGDIEIIRRDTIQTGSVSGDRVIPLIIEHDDMIDIDEFEDLARAENKLGGGN